LSGNGSLPGRRIAPVDGTGKGHENLAKSALVTNGLVWFGLALLFAGIAGEQTGARSTLTGATLSAGSSPQPPRSEPRHSLRSKYNGCARMKPHGWPPGWRTPP